MEKVRAILVNPLAILIDEVEGVAPDVITFVDDRDLVACFCKFPSQNCTGETSAYDKNFHFEFGRLRFGAIRSF
jgi:hypothetical protein